MASGISNTFRQVGVATGIAALGAILQAQVTSSVVDSLRGTQGIVASQVANQVATGSTKQAIAAASPSARAAIGHAARDRVRLGAERHPARRRDRRLRGAAAGFLLVRRRDFVHRGVTAAAAAK